MRKIMKRGFCLFLVAVLLAGLVPCAFADEAMPTEEMETSEAATEAAEETTAPPETEVPSESTKPPSETTEPPEATEATELETEVTEPEADPVEDAPEDAVEDDRLAAYASTVTNVLLFDKASPNYTTVLRSQVSVTYNPNGSDAAKTAYIKNLGWHFARYNNVPYEDDPLYCIEPCKNYAASTSGNYMDEDLGVSGSGSTRGSNVWYAMPYSYRQAIALTLLYSRQLWDSNYSVKTTSMANNPNVSTRIATQFLIYEIVTGLRDADTFNRRGSNGYTSGDVFYNAGVAQRFRLCGEVQQHCFQCSKRHENPQLHQSLLRLRTHHHHEWEPGKRYGFQRCTGELLLHQWERCFLFQVREYLDHHQNRLYFSVYSVQCYPESALCGKLHCIHLLQCQQHLPDLRQAVFSPGGYTAGLF